AWRGFDITTNTHRATWSIQRRSMWPRRARDRRAVRKSTTRERPSPSLLRWCLNLSWPHGGGGAGRHRRSALADVSQALPRRCPVDSSERHPGNTAKVPSLSGCLLCDWNRNRNLNVGRDLPADGAGGAVRGNAVVSGSQPRTPLHRAAREIAVRTGTKAAPTKVDDFRTKARVTPGCCNDKKERNDE